MKIGSRTPWGKADHVVVAAPGIWFVGTPGHGGYKLDAKHNAKVHEAWRLAGGWYEEDCDWARVVLTFPELFASHLAQATATAKNYAPDAYTLVTGQPVEIVESSVLLKRAFDATVVDRYVATSAWGDWHPGVPKGFVGVFATLGGLRVNEGKHFLVTATDYDARGRHGYVVDETRDQPWAGERATSKVGQVVISQASAQ